MPLGGTYRCYAMTSSPVVRGRRRVRYRIYMSVSKCKEEHYCGNFVFTLLNIDKTVPCPTAKLSLAERPGTVPSLS
jgi:hypothetical protein